MKNHTKIYLNKMGYEDTDYIPCEVCEEPCTDVHHISSRGIGGTGRNRIRGVQHSKDFIENLVGLCRTCHNLCEQHKDFNERVKVLHLKLLRHKSIV